MGRQVKWGSSSSCSYHYQNFTDTFSVPPPPPAAILDDQSVCGRGERLALALARENINSLMEGAAQARVEVDVYELQNDSQYSTTDTSESRQLRPRLRPRLCQLTVTARVSAVREQQQTLFTKDKMKPQASDPEIQSEISI